MRIISANLRRWLICLLAGFALLHFALAWRVRDLTREGYSDFIIFYEAGKIVSRGSGAWLYDQSLQGQMQQEFAPRVVVQRAQMHPPFEALLFVPLSWLPYLSAYLLWNVLNLVVLILVRDRLRAHIALLRHSTRTEWILAQLAYFPVFIALLHGQDILLLLLLFTLAFLSLKKNHEYAGGCWLGLGLFRFHQVLPVALVLILQKRMKAIFALLLVALGYGLMSLAVSGWQGTSEYLDYVWHAEERLTEQGAVLPEDMPNLHGLVDVAVTPVTSRRFGQVTTGLASVLLLVFVARRWRYTEHRAFDLGFSLCVTAAVLTSYHAFAQDLSLLVLPITLVINHLMERSGDLRWFRASLLIPICLLLFSPLQVFLAMHRGNLFWLMALVLIAWLVGLAREISRVQAPEQSMAR